ncbi:unnamed protein product [[Candida] boidinii]|nr:unnamed protein product [[Candida] boidinii]
MLNGSAYSETPKNIINNNNNNSNNKANNINTNNNNAQNNQQGANDNIILDSFLKSFQNGDLFNLFNNLQNNNFPNKNPLYPLPLSLDKNFSSEEQEVIIYKSSDVSTNPTSSGEIGVLLNAEIDLSFAASSALTWMVFLRDFYINSLMHISSESISEFICMFHETLLENFCHHPNETVSDVVIDTFKSNSDITLGKRQLKILQWNILSYYFETNAAKLPEPILYIPSGNYFFPNSYELVPKDNMLYYQLDELYIKYLINEIRSNIPEKKILIVLFSRFFKSLGFFFPFLDQTSLTYQLYSLSSLLYDNFESDSDYKKYILKNSIGFTLDTIGLLYVVLNISYSLVIDSIKERLAESNFNENSLLNSEKYLMSSEVNIEKFTSIAKRCFSYNFKFDNIYSYFPVIEFAVKKVQLGLVILIDGLFFKDEVNNRFRCFEQLLAKKEGVTVAEDFKISITKDPKSKTKHCAPVSQAACDLSSSVNGQTSDTESGVNGVIDGISCKHKSSSSLSSQYSNNSVSGASGIDSVRDKFFKSKLSDLPSDIAYEMKLNSDKGSFINGGKDISGQSVKKLEALFGIDECQKMLNNQMANISHEFSELVKFATLLKLDKDPTNSVGSQNDNQLKKNSYQEGSNIWLNIRGGKNEIKYFD